MRPKPKIMVDYKKHRIKSSKFESNDVKAKQEWRDFVMNFEKQPTVVKRNPTNLSQPLPGSLRTRCEGILRESIPSLGYGKPTPIEKKEVKFDKKPQYKYFDDDAWDVCIESAGPERQFYKPKTNWVELFSSTRKVERIKWPSKIYKSVFAFDSKNLFGQTDELVDNAAEEFVEWLNTMGKEKSFLTKDVVKEKFSVGIQEAHTQPLSLNTQVLHAIPQEMADFLDMPEMSLQSRIKSIHEADERKKQKQKASGGKNVAFGRTLPVELRQPKIETEIDEISPIFPEHIRTGENIFKGICHLRATKMLVKYMLTDDTIVRPEYLVKRKMFDHVAEEEAYVPLYEIFGNQ